MEGERKRRKILSLRVFLFLLLPLLASLFFIQNPKLDFNWIDNSSCVFISEKEIYNPNSKLDNLNKAMGVPFDLNYFKFCFTDSTKYQIEDDAVKESSFYWNMFVWNDKINETLSINLGETECTQEIFFKENPARICYDSKLNSNVSINFSEFSSQDPTKFMIMTPYWSVYAMQHENTLLAKRIILFVAILSLIWLSTRIRKIIKEGWWNC